MIDREMRLYADLKDYIAKLEVMTKHYETEKDRVMALEQLSEIDLHHAFSITLSVQCFGGRNIDVSLKDILTQDDIAHFKDQARTQMNNYISKAKLIIDSEPPEI